MGKLAKNKAILSPNVAGDDCDVNNRDGKEGDETIN